MYVPQEFLQVGFLLADDGLVAVLKKVAATSVPSVETSGIAGEEPCHEAVETENESKRKAIMDKILIYNKEDLAATWAVFLWLKKKAQEAS
jgi:predicted RecB family nuclease